MTLADVKCVLAGIWRRPLGVAVAVLSLGLGCALNVAVCRALIDIYSAPLPYADEQRLATMRIATDEGKRYFFTGNEVRALRQLKTLFESVATIERWPMSRRAWTVLQKDGGTAQRVAAGIVRPDFFQMLGVRAAIGRTFTASDRMGSPAVVISDRLFTRVFAGSTNVIGRSVRIGENASVVVGVLPAAFVAPVPLVEGRPEYDDIDVWLVREREEEPDRALLYNLVLRTRTPVNRAPSTYATDAACQALRASGTSRTDGCAVESVRTAMVGVQGNRASMLLWLSVLLMAIGLVNVAGVLILRSLEHQRHLAVRWALGATGRRLWTIPAAEAVAFTVGGTMCGGGLGLWGYAATTRLSPVVRWSGGAGVVPGILLVAFLVMVVASLCAFAVVAVMGRRMFLGGVLAGGAREASRPLGLKWQRGVVRVQLLTVLSLVTPAVAAWTAFLTLPRGQALLARADLLVAECWMVETANAEVADILRNQERLEQAARLIPGVLEVGSSSDIPVAGVRRPNYLVQLPKQRRVMWAYGAHVDPEYFDVVRARRVAGRVFRASEGARASGVAVVSLSFARKAFGYENVVGQTIEWHGRREIIGVVEDQGFGEGIDLPRPAIYVSRLQEPVMRFCLYVRADARRVPAVLERLARLDPEQPFDRIEPLNRIGDRCFREQRGYALWAGTLALVGLPLGLLGIGVAANYSVASRLKEIAVRRALGASPARVIGLMLGREFNRLWPAALLAVPIELWLLQSAANQMMPLKLSPWRAILTTVASMCVICAATTVVSAWRHCGDDVAQRLRSAE
jgi:predicted permease